MDEIKRIYVTYSKRRWATFRSWSLKYLKQFLEFDKNIFLEKFLDLFGHRLLEVHISENNGFKDEHLGARKNSWQLNQISKYL